MYGRAFRKYDFTDKLLVLEGHGVVRLLYHFIMVGLSCVSHWDLH